MIALPTFCCWQGARERGENQEGKVEGGTGVSAERQRGCEKGERLGKGAGNR